MLSSQLYPSYLITGASSGIGQALALELAERAAIQRVPLSLALLSRRRSALEHTRQLVLDVYPEAFIYIGILDVTQSYNEIELSYQQVHDAFSSIPIHCFIINAGVASPLRLIGDKNGFENERQVAMTNFVGAITCIDVAVKYIKSHNVNHTPSKAHIVSVSSFAGSVPFPFIAVYSATKAGLDAYMRSLEVETTGLGIHITNFKPGFIDTPINAQFEHRPFVIHVDKSAKLMVDQISSRVSWAYIPRFPWSIIIWLLYFVPNSIIMKFAHQTVESQKTATK